MWHIEIGDACVALVSVAVVILDVVAPLGFGAAMAIPIPAVIPTAVPMAAVLPSAAASFLAFIEVPFFFALGRR